MTERAQTKALEPKRLIGVPYWPLSNFGDLGNVLDYLEPQPDL